MNSMSARSILILCLAMGVSACAGIPRVVGDQQDSEFAYQQFKYAAGGRDLATVIYGNPFGADVAPAVLNEAVTSAMDGSHFGPPTNFTTQPGPLAREDFRVVLAFNPTENVPSELLCRNVPIETAPGPAVQMVVQGAFCYRNGTVSSATGYLARPASPTSGNFQALISHLTMTMFLPPWVGDGDSEREDDVAGAGGQQGATAS